MLLNIPVPLSRTKTFGAILFAGIIAHGGVFFATNRFLYDGALYWYHISRGQVGLHRQWLYAAGHPLHAWMTELLGFFQNPLFGHALITFSALVAAAIFLNLLLNRLAVLSEDESLLASLFFLTLPFVSVWPAVNFMPYAVCLSLYVISAYLWSCSRPAPALFFLFLSFGLKSMLLLGPASLATISWIQRRKFSWKSDLLPIAAAGLFGLCMKLGFPQQGRYVNYNRPAFSIRNALWGFKEAAKEFLRQAVLVVEQVVSDPSVALTLVVLVGLVGAYATVRYLYRKREERIGHLNSIGVALSLIAVALLPYILVTKPPTAVGYSSRHAIAAIAPLALLIVFMMRPIWCDLRASRRRIVLWTLGGLIVGASSYTDIVRYREWSLRKLQDEALYEAMRLHSSLADSSTFVLEERPDFPALGNPQIRYYEYTALLNAAWGEQQKWCIFDLSGGDIEKDFPPFVARVMADASALGSSNLVLHFQAKEPVIGLRIKVNPDFQRSFSIVEMIRSAVSVERRRAMLKEFSIEVYPRPLGLKS